MPRDNNWSKSEIEAAVSAYLELLRAEERGEDFSPTSVHRRLSETELPGRSEGSVARRMSNISSVLSHNGRKWISRYKPSLDHVGARVEEMILGAVDSFESGDRIYGLQPIDLLTQAIEILDSGKVRRPSGNAKPKYRSQTVTVYSRDPRVVAWVIQEAKGVCEGCGRQAPFTLLSGDPYLEVHHVLRLADGGPDVIENAVAICPNCHRRLHHSADRDTYRTDLIASIERLRDFERDR